MSASWICRARAASTFCWLWRQLVFELRFPLRDVLRVAVVRDLVLCAFELGCAVEELVALLPTLLWAGFDAGFAFAAALWSACEKASADTNSIVLATPTAFFGQAFDGFMRNSIPLENKQFAFGRPWSLSDFDTPRQSIRPTALAWEMIPESGSRCQSPLGDDPVTEVYLR